jgi:hypothetical protein
VGKPPPPLSVLQTAAQSNTLHRTSFLNRDHAVLIFFLERGMAAAAPSCARRPRRGIFLWFGRILINCDARGPKAVEFANRANAQKLAVLFIDCERHAFRQEGAIAALDFCRFEFFESGTIILRHELGNLLSVRLPLAADDRVHDARRLRHCRHSQRDDCGRSKLAHEIIANIPRNEGRLLVEAKGYTGHVFAVKLQLC